MRVTAHAFSRMAQRLGFTAISHDTLSDLADQCARAITDREPLKYIGMGGRKFRAVRFQYFGFKGHAEEATWLKRNLILVTDPEDEILITVIEPEQLTHHLIGRAYDEGKLKNG